MHETTPQKLDDTPHKLELKMEDTGTAGGKIEVSPLDQGDELTLEFNKTTKSVKLEIREAEEVNCIE